MKWETLNQLSSIHESPEALSSAMMSNGTLKKLCLLGNDWEDDGLEVRGGYESDRFGCHGGWWMRSLGDPCFSMVFLSDSEEGKDERSWG